MPPKLKWPSGFLGESNLAHEFNDCIPRWGASKHTLTTLVVFRWVETIVTSLSPTLKLLDAFKRFGNEAVILSQKNTNTHTHIFTTKMLHMPLNGEGTTWKLTKLLQPKPTRFTNDHDVLDVCFSRPCHWAVVPTSDRWPKALIALQDRVFRSWAPVMNDDFHIWYYWIIVPSGHWKMPSPKLSPPIFEFET